MELDSSLLAVRLLLVFGDDPGHFFHNCVHLVHDLINLGFERLVVRFGQLAPPYLMDN